MKSNLLRLLVVGLLLFSVGTGWADEDECPEPLPRDDVYTNVGLLGLHITNLGYFGNSFSLTTPSGEYPLTSNVEHIYSGGLWVGALTTSGQRRVSTGSQDANGVSQGNETREFDLGGFCEETDGMRVLSNSQNFNNFSLEAQATQHIKCSFNDYANPEGGGHIPLGIRVNMEALAWSSSYADDFVILEYTIINISDSELQDVYLGLWVDTTVGNTQQNDPYDPQAPIHWNYRDDTNGAFGAVGHVDPAYTIADDPDIWMAYERDADGDLGLATSWIGYRLLGTSEEPQPEAGMPPVSYNAWKFRGVPLEDDIYIDEDNPEEELPGKYQVMSNGHFDVGQTPNGDYTEVANWVSLMSTGPFPRLAPMDTVSVTFAVVAGPDSLGLLSNSRIAQRAYDEGFDIPTGPPSPRLEFGFDEDSVILRWAPGDSLSEEGLPLSLDDPARSPEHHISNITNQEDFQGYRILRYQGREIDTDPLLVAEVVAQFDKVDGIGFDTGLPPLNDEGLREFVDTGLLDGFPYWYSVISFSAPNPLESLPEYPSGFYENARLVYPGPGASSTGHGKGVGVFPNPYRAAGLFDDTEVSDVEIGRKIWFTRLPAHCRIQVFTLSGEVVKTIDHDDPNTGMASWDTLTDHGRAIATGLYIYAVTDHDTGEVQRGKLVIIK